MLVSLRPSRYWHARGASIALSGALVAAPFVAPALAAGCSFAPQGEGRVAAATDARGFRLEDGREVRLAGIEAVSSATTRKDRTAALAALVAGHDVTLHGQVDAPDRYGRQVAFVYLAGTETLAQAELLRQGEALGSADATDKDCAMTLAAAEAEARQAKRGTWAGAMVIKNAESSDDILAGIGRFTLVEGKVLSRTAGRGDDLSQFWTELDTGLCCDYFKAHDAGDRSCRAELKSLENKRIRVRGFVEARGGPRIELLQVGQIEVLGMN